MLLFGTSAISTVAGWCRAKIKTRDMLEFAQTVVFAMQLTGSWRMCVQLLIQHDSSDFYAVVGTAMSGSLLVLEAYNAVGAQIRSYHIR